MDEQIIDESNDPTAKSKTIPSDCKICGAPALYKYFGTTSCHACKIFFKRNAQTGLVSSNEYIIIIIIIHFIFL